MYRRTLLSGGKAVDTYQSAKADERTVVVLRANAWGFAFLGFAILADIMYRNLVFHEAAWDLVALLGVSGVISMVYAARYKVMIFDWKFGVIMAVVALVAAIVAAAVEVIRAM
jgi:hypothetical protein